MMMKKIITIITAAFMAISASAQSEAGSLTWKPNVGMTYTTATGFLGKYSDGAVGVTAGVEAMYMLKEKFGVALGLNYTGYNVSDKFSGESDGSICSNYYFNIPITANYYIAPGLALKAGVALNILSTANIQSSFVYNNLEYYYFENPSDAANYVSSLKVGPAKDYYKSTFFSIPLGASYEYKNVVFDARYNLGLGKACDWCDGTFNSFSFTVGYKF